MMKLNGFYFPMAAFSVLVMFGTVPASAQNKKADSAVYVSNINGERYKLRTATDDKRKCLARQEIIKKSLKQAEANRKLKASGQSTQLLSNVSLGNNPQEGQYRMEMERLLVLEIGNVGRAVKDLERKHKEMLHIYPHLRNYHEIVLKDIPGTYRYGQYVNMKAVLALHYTNEGKLSCLVLESTTRNIEYPDFWTRKYMRLYLPQIQFMELEALRHNYRRRGSLEHASPEVQLKALRLIFSNLRSALYSMDMLIAAYHDMREKQNQWQVSL